MSFIESVQNTIARLIVKLPEKLMIKMSGGKPREVAGRIMDPQLQLVTSLSSKAPQLHDLPLKSARGMIDNFCTTFDKPSIKVASIKDISIAVEGGEIKLRLIKPLNVSGSKLPAVLYYHGGGMVIGSVDGYENFCAQLADKCACLVIAVEYRLAPEHKFPVGLDDAFSAYKWAREHASELGIEAGRISVAGDSAGGYISAIMCHRAREAGIPQPRCQFLIYPMADLRAKTQSYSLFAEGCGLSRENMNWFINEYINDEADRLNPQASPLLHEDFSGLAPAVMVTAGFDPLIDEGKAYGEKLRAAGNDINYLQMDSMIHGFICMSGHIHGARKAVDQALQAFKEKV